MKNKFDEWWEYARQSGKLWDMALRKTEKEFSEIIWNEAIAGENKVEEFVPCKKK